VDLEEWLADTDALTALDAAYAAAWAATDAELLTLCRNRMAMLLRHQPTLDQLTADATQALAAWPSSTTLTDLQRAALEFTEQYIIDVASLSDAQADALRKHLDDAEFATFVNALLVVEQRMSLELVLAGVL
jgi:hypothetical protein